MGPSVRAVRTTAVRCRTTCTPSGHEITDIFGRILCRTAPQFASHVFAKSTVIGTRFFHWPAPIVGTFALAALANRGPPASPPVFHTNLADPLIVAAMQWLAVNGCPSLNYNNGADNPRGRSRLAA